MKRLKKADDIQRAGFTENEDYLLKITPMQLDDAFLIYRWPEDEFDIHASQHLKRHQ